MANPSQPGPGPDDDSWGKIASDLFGIQFNDGDDFELPDDDAPRKSQPTTPVQSVPVENQAVEQPASTVESEDDSTEEVETSKPSVPGSGSLPAPRN